ncbi:MAG: choline dehydrogenase [Verrucomicrobiota bacterium]|jgi:choline dehydrogenase
MSDTSSRANPKPNGQIADFAERVRVNQKKLVSDLKPHYDFIVCGSGSSGSVVARRLAENPGLSVLLLEAGGNDDLPSISDGRQWASNIKTERDWNFQTRPNPHLNGRSDWLAAGKVLGGGSSINAMAWARGHKSDWDYFAREAGDPAWSYESVLNIYRRIEDWQGAPDPDHRGTGGLLFINSGIGSGPIVPAMFEGTRSVGIPTFDSINGRMMEGPGGCSLIEFRMRDWQRLSIFRSYTFPYMDRPNLTVLTSAPVTRLIFEGRRVTGVEFTYQDRVRRIGAGLEVVLSLGAINTPKVLMQSGVGDQAELHRFGIPLVEHLPGVGQNFQDHVALPGMIWECRGDEPNAVFHWFWKSDSSLDTPDLQTTQAPLELTGFKKLNPTLPASGWMMLPAVIRTKSRGRVRLTGPGPLDPADIESNLLSDPDDLKALVAVVELCREIANSDALRPFLKQEVVPGKIKGPALENYLRSTAISWWHQTCTAKMGRDSLSVVDTNLKVYGIENLRIADGSIMPRVTTGNTMAPCVIIGERAGEILRAQHKI